MNAVAILGSRNPEGQTARAADAFCQGISQAGGQSEKIFLTHLNIERCRQCEQNGWGLCRSEGRCVIEDDFAGVVEKMKAAGGVVFANPVYFSDLSESLKSFLDRLRRTCRHEAGKQGIAGKLAAGICVAGSGGGGAPMATVSLERVLGTCGFDTVDMVPVRRQNLELKCKVLTETGKWFASLTPSA